MPHIKILTAAVFAVVSFVTHSQTEDDIVRFSKLGFTGSARYMGMGGAMGALGADFSVATTNPAGLARFSNSYLSITPSLDMSNSIGVFSNNEEREANAGVGLPDVSLVRHFTETKGGWNSFQVAIGYTRLNDFDNTIIYQGNANTSLLHDFAESGAGLDFDPQFGPTIQEFRPFTTNLAYQTFAIDPLTDQNGNLVLDDNGNVSYVAQIPYGTTVNQTREIYRTGHHGAFNLAFSGNYQNKIYVGASMGIRRISFNEGWSHTEEVMDTSGLFIRNFNYNYSLDIVGVGVNLKAGAIFIPFEWLRLGAAIHTPTRYNMTDRWNASMTSTFFDQSYSINGEDRPTGSFKYVMRTPFRAILSAAYMLQKRGILSVDVEYLDYRTAAFKPRGNDNTTDYTNTNMDINDRLASALNIRAGVDIRVYGNFSWRFGMGYYGLPYNEQVIDTDPNRHYLTTGFGLRTENFSFDLGYMLHRRNEDYYAYQTELNGPSRALLKNRNSVINITFGYRF